MDLEKVRAGGSMVIALIELAHGMSETTPPRGHSPLGPFDGCIPRSADPGIRSPMVRRQRPATGLTPLDNEHDGRDPKHSASSPCTDISAWLSAAMYQDAQCANERDSTLTYLTNGCPRMQDLWWQTHDA